MLTPNWGVRSQTKLGIFRSALEHPGRSLHTNLVSYWKLDEISNSSVSVVRADSYGTNHLPDPAKVPSAAGKLGSCASFSPVTYQYIRLDGSSALSVGQQSAEWICWVSLKSNGTYRFIDKDNQTSNREYAVRYSTGGPFQFFGWFGAGSGTIKLVGASTFGAAQLATWYMIDAYFDSPNHQIGISVNNETFDTLDTGSDTLVAALGDFAIGGAHGDYPDALVDSVGFWRGRLLSNFERSWLYNQGNGRVFPF